jgi:hypothetical protein
MIAGGKLDVGRWLGESRSGGPWVGRLRGQDESDGPMGVYAVGLAWVFACREALRRAVSTRNSFARLNFYGTTHLGPVPYSVT